LDDIIKLKNKINPDLVIMPSKNDIHQDHSTIADEAVRAFKFTSILAYELVWNSFNFTTSCFVVLNEKEMNKKVQALKSYKSQAHKSYASEEFLRSLANVRGVQINEKLAEAFEVIRWVIK
jgi:LmbE family N-acetylglucosaminyl deacetylase